MIKPTSMRKLGRISSGPTPYLPALNKYLAKSPLPAPPADIDWGRDITWPMLKNDILGICGPAAVLHFWQTAMRWRDGVAPTPTDAEAVAIYEQLGYDPHDPSTDTGVSIADMLEMWVKVGFTIGGELDKPLAIIRLNQNNQYQMAQAAWLFGPIILGVSLPISAQTQDVWSAPEDASGNNAPDSWGGHCVLNTGIHPNMLDYVSWGEDKKAEPKWEAAYIEEAWAVLHPIWVSTGRSPSGWMEDELIKDMQAIA